MLVGYIAEEIEKKNSLFELKERRYAIMETQIKRSTLTMKEASEYLGISYWLINQLVRKKQIPYCKVGGKYLFRVNALNEYLSNMEQQSMK